MPDADIALPPAGLPAVALVSALMAVQARNWNALATMQVAAVGAIGSLARQQREVVSAMVRKATAISGALMSPDPRAALALPFDTLGDAIRDASACSLLLGGAAAKGHAAVSEILQNRLLDALEEPKAALLRAVPPGATG